MAKRHCLRIPFLIGQRDDSIIGNSCADNPAWSVPCDPASFGEVVCDPGDLPALLLGSSSFLEVPVANADLDEPTEVTVSFG